MILFDVGYQFLLNSNLNLTRVNIFTLTILATFDKKLGAFESFVLRKNLIYFKKIDIRTKK